MLVTTQCSVEAAPGCVLTLSTYNFTSLAAPFFRSTTPVSTEAATIVKLDGRNVRGAVAWSGLLVAPMPGVYKFIPTLTTPAALALSLNGVQVNLLAPGLELKAASYWFELTYLAAATHSDLPKFFRLQWSFAAASSELATALLQEDFTPLFACPNVVGCPVALGYQQASNFCRGFQFENCLRFSDQPQADYHVGAKKPFVWDGTFQSAAKEAALNGHAAFAVSRGAPNASFTFDPTSSLGQSLVPTLLSGRCSAANCADNSILPGGTPGPGGFYAVYSRDNGPRPPPPPPPPPPRNFTRPVLDFAASKIPAGVGSGVGKWANLGSRGSAFNAKGNGFDADAAATKLPELGFANGTAHVTFAAKHKQFMNVPPQFAFDWLPAANVDAPGTGLTLVVHARFTGNNIWERLFDFSSTTGMDNIVLARYATGVTVAAAYFTAGQVELCPSPMPADGLFHAFVMRTNNTLVGTVMDVFVDTIDAASAVTCTSQTRLTNRTTVDNYIGKSSFNGDGYLDGDVRRVMLFDAPLGNDALQVVLASL